ncbi:MAG: DNA N-6-adenine-methyltransferase [Nanoarchaeota archaeon]
MKNRNLIHIDHWKTPKEFYEKLNGEFNFNFDPCPLHPKFNGLLIDWEDRNFVNPPYSRKLKEAFIRKAFEESRNGKLCVMLLPVSTSTKIFHEIIYPNSEIRFVKNRISFEGTNSFGQKVGKGSAPMHDSMICIFRPKTNGGLK